jgi:dTMP kinase
MARGVFITLEGGEGGGKSTQAKLLGAALAARGHDVLLTREPGGSPGAESIRALLVQGDAARWDGMTEALLHTAARRDHLTKTVLPALGQGRVVISDRFADSTMAYQGYGHGVDRPTLAALYRAAAGTFLPDLTLILDLPVDVGLARAAARATAPHESRYETMAVAFHQRLRDGFRAIAAAEPARCRLIDADRPVAAIQADILAAALPICEARVGHGRARS